MSSDPSERDPKVSAILVVYNREGTLPATLESLLEQTYADFELIISDDCSTDRSAEVALRYAERDPRFRYRRNPSNLKMPGNLNAALAEARGEYVAILHDGDKYRPDLLERWAEALDRHPEAAFVFNAYDITDHHGRRRVDVCDMPECMDGLDFLREVFLPNLGGSPVFGTTMIRRRCLDEQGLFDPTYSISSDVVMWVQLASKHAVAYVAEPLMWLLPHEPGHFLDRHYWWRRTFNIYTKRLAFRICYPGQPLRRARFELKVWLHYAWCLLPPLRHRRWGDVWTGLRILTTGRDAIAPPY